MNKKTDFWMQLGGIGLITCISMVAMLAAIIGLSLGAIGASLTTWQGVALYLAEISTLQIVAVGLALAIQNALIAMIILWKLNKLGAD